MMDSNAKVALVTGGAQGIGKGIAIAFLEAGWSVAIVDLDAEAGEETAGELGARGPVAFFRCDVGDEADARAAVEATVARFGRIDALVNNAGIAGAPRIPVEHLALADWDRMIRANLTGAFLMAKHAVPHLRTSRGTIVNIASTRALQSEANTEAYSASKGGLVALTHALSVTLGPDIRVNCVSPGWIDTSGWRKQRLRKPEALRPEDHAQHPAGRVGTPEDIGAMVLFLASEGSGFITGQNFVVDGGMTRKMIYED